MPQTAVDFFAGKRLSLTGVLMRPEGLGAPVPAAVICHSHPLLRGSMAHPMVTAISQATAQQGMAALRFNFRGVGDSDGTFTNGAEEQDDIHAALEILKLLPGVDKKRLALVGYSFGASVILDGLQRYRSARSVALIAPPLSSVTRPRALKDKRPKLFVVGQRDRVVPSSDLQRALDGYRAPVEFTEVPDSNHSLEGQESFVAERVARFLLSTLS